MYGCESWTMKKAEHQRINVFELWCCRRLLRAPWTARRSNLSILMEISLEYSLEGLKLKLKLQYFDHLMWKTDLLEKTPMLGKIEGRMPGNVWREDPYVLSLMSPLSLFKRNSTLLPGTEVIVWGRVGSPLVNILFRTKLFSLAPLSWDMDCLLTLWLTLPLVPLVTVAVCLVFWSLSFLKEVSCTTAYIYS